MFLMIQKLLTKLIKIFISHNHSDRVDRRSTLVNNAVLFFWCLQEDHVLRDHCHSDGASWAPDVAPIDRNPHSSDNSRTQVTIWWCTSMEEIVDKNQKQKQNKGSETRCSYTVEEGIVNFNFLFHFKE